MKLKKENSVYRKADNSYITKTSCWLYKRTVTVLGTEETATVFYDPFQLEDIKTLKILRDGLTGDLDAIESHVFSNSVMRFGWLDKEFNSLEWLSLKELREKKLNNTITKQEKGKLSHVCRLLFISVKDIK